jgi:hypothetical protein
MGVMTFQVPVGLSADAVDRLRRAYIASGYDHSPSPVQSELQGDRLTIRRESEDSGCCVAAWDIPGVGRLVGGSSTLMERPNPYRLLTELARGKVNQIRSQAAEWKHAGLDLRGDIDDRIRAATTMFSKAVLETEPALADQRALETLTVAYEAAHLMSTHHSNQLFALRRDKGDRADLQLGCRLTDVPAIPLDGLYKHSFNAVSVPMNWNACEPTESNYNWGPSDRVLTWAEENNLSVSAGPLIDFSRTGAPNWLRAWDGDLPSIASFMCDYLETAVNRYKHRVRRWLICSGSNSSLAFGLSEDDLIRLTARLAEAVWSVDSSLEVVVGLAQPWGEYLTGEHFNYSPFIFADTLMRAGLPLAAFEIEWHMGVSPRGCFCRDPLEASKQLDLFAMLGCPLQVALSYPSSAEVDAHADPSLTVGEAGWWHDISAAGQASWAETFAAIALSKSFVRGGYWDHFSDSSPHRYPNGGLVDSNGSIKPALEKLRNLKENHLQGQHDTLLM